MITCRAGASPLARWRYVQPATDVSALADDAWERNMR
jgi:hypothetical protein